MNVLDHDDRVVDQYADREDQREQRYPVERKSPGPGCEQRHRQRHQHRGADDHRLARAERDHHQQHDHPGRECQLLDQRHRLFVGGFTVVARHRNLDAVGNQNAAQLRDPLDDLAGDVDRVAARLLGYGDGHRRESPARVQALVVGGRPGTEPEILLGLGRLDLDGRHLAELDRHTVRQPDDQIFDFRGLA